MDTIAVLDLGSHTLKAGMPFSFPTDGEPSVVVPTCVVAQENAVQASEGKASQSLPVHVIQRGIVCHWEGLEALLYHTLFRRVRSTASHFASTRLTRQVPSEISQGNPYNKGSPQQAGLHTKQACLDLQLAWEETDEGLLIVSEPLFYPRADRERLTQLLFEQFNVAGVFMCEQSILSLYSISKTSGTVVDLGHGKIDIAPVVEGQIYYPAARRLNYGGQDVTEHLRRLLEQQDTAFKELPTADLQLLKEQCLRVAESREAASLEEFERKEFQLSDGRTISLGREGLQLGEALLDGKEMGIDEPAVAESVLGAISSHPDPAVRKVLVENIFVCGGGSSAPGLGPRLLREVSSLAPPSLQPGLCPTPEYMPDYTVRMAAWMGGAVLSKVVFAQNHHVSKCDYDEMGPPAVHKKCFA